MLLAGWKVHRDGLQIISQVSTFLITVLQYLVWLVMFVVFWMLFVLFVFVFAMKIKKIGICIM